MYRWLICAFLILSLPSLPALAQSGRSSGANGSSAAVHAPPETFTGSLRSISGTDLTIDTGDDTPVRVQIQNTTKYLSTMGKVKASDFEPGDHVTVEATRDDGNHYVSTAITMNKKGTAEDKANAVRANSPGAAAAPAAVTSPAAATSGDSTSEGRPSLHRANSSGDNSAGAQATASASSGSDTVPSSTVSPAVSRRQPVPPPSPSGASTTDDSGPPVLRRSAPATSDSAPAAQAASAARPSLSAEDVNGVTRMPAAPPPPTAGSDGEMRVSPGDDDVIDQTREVASSFTQTLPNYIVKQFTTRYVSDSASRGRTSWQALDVVTADLVYLDGKENYMNIMANGRPTRDASQTGSWSEGEFASSLLALLSPFSATEFRNKRPVTIVNRPAYKYDYSIDQRHSAWRIQTEGQNYQPAYNGSIWIDKDTFRVLRIEMAAREMPRSFPIDTTESSLDYDFVLIGDQKYLLPVHSESLSCWRGTTQCSRNVIDFRNYKKYTADSSITFGGTVPDK